VQIKIHHQFRKHGCAFMLEFGILVLVFCFYFICFALKLLLEKALEK